MNRLATVVLISSAIWMAGCKSESSSPPAADDAVENTAKPMEAKKAGGHHGKPVALGEATIGKFKVRAARDDGAIVAGKDAPIDVWLTGDISRVQAVRFWIGTKTAESSIKVRADIENPKEPNHWHTHAEIPDPIPAGSQLWVEIETDKDTGSGAFDLKA